MISLRKARTRTDDVTATDIDRDPRMVEIGARPAIAHKSASTSMFRTLEKKKHTMPSTTEANDALLFVHDSLLCLLRISRCFARCYEDTAAVVSIQKKI